MRRSKGKVVGSIVGPVILELKQLCVFGCFSGRELWGCMISILDSTLVVLVEASISLVFSSLFSIMRGLSERR